MSVVSESDVVPSGGDVAEHWPIDMSHVPESHAVVTSGHPWHIPETQTPFLVCALKSSHLRVSPQFVRARFEHMRQLHAIHKLSIRMDSSVLDTNVLVFECRTKVIRGLSLTRRPVCIRSAPTGRGVAGAARYHASAVG